MDREGCVIVGLPFTPTGNLVQVINDSDFFTVRNGNRVDFFDRDAIFLGAGFTGTGEFSPELPTSTFGDILLDGVGLNIISTADRSLNDSVLLPDSAGFVTSEEVDTAFLEISLISEGLAEEFTLRGELDDFVVPPDGGPAPIPLPPAAILLASSLLSLLAVGRLCRKRKESLA